MRTIEFFWLLRASTIGNLFLNAKKGKIKILNELNTRLNRVGDVC